MSYLSSSWPLRTNLLPPRGHVDLHSKVDTCLERHHWHVDTCHPEYKHVRVEDPIPSRHVAKWNADTWTSGPTCRNTRGTELDFGPRLLRPIKRRSIYGCQLCTRPICGGPLRQACLPWSFSWPTHDRPFNSLNVQPYYPGPLFCCNVPKNQLQKRSVTSCPSMLVR